MLSECYVFGKRNLGSLFLITEGSSILGKNSLLTIHLNGIVVHTVILPD